MPEATAGYRAALFLEGTAVPVVAAAATLQTVTVFQITNVARRLIDPNAPVVVRANAVVVPAAGYSINFLFGKITFAVAPTAPVTVDYSYIPFAEACSVRGVSVSLEREPLDVTTFCTAEADQGRRKFMGLRSVSVSIDSVDNSADIARGDWLKTLLATDDIPVVIEFWPARTGTASIRIRGFVTSIEDSVAVEGLTTASISFEASQYLDSGAIARSQD
jgi:hypothetical protein